MGWSGDGLCRCWGFSAGTPERNSHQAWLILTTKAACRTTAGASRFPERVFFLEALRESILLSQVPYRSRHRMRTQVSSGIFITLPHHFQFASFFHDTTAAHQEIGCVLKSLLVCPQECLAASFSARPSVRCWCDTVIPHKPCCESGGKGIRVLHWPGIERGGGEIREPREQCLS